MSATLEQVNILYREFDLDEKEYMKALDTMRRLNIEGIIQKVLIDQQYLFVLAMELAGTTAGKILTLVRCNTSERIIDSYFLLFLDKYAFTMTQLATFPRNYRPPIGSYGSKLT